MWGAGERSLGKDSEFYLMDKEAERDPETCELSVGTL